MLLVYSLWCIYGFMYIKEDETRKHDEWGVEWRVEWWVFMIYTTTIMIMIGLSVCVCQYAKYVIKIE